MKAASLYKKGVRKERKIVNEAKAQGKTAFRSAGSHGKIDVIIIDPEAKHIQLIQAKTYEPSKKEAQRIMEAGTKLAGFYNVTFEIQ